MKATRLLPPGTPRATSPEREHAYLIDDPKVRDAIIERNVKYLLGQDLPRDLVLRYIMEAGGDPSLVPAPIPNESAEGQAG